MQSIEHLTLNMEGAAHQCLRFLRDWWERCLSPCGVGFPNRCRWMRSYGNDQGALVNSFLLALATIFHALARLIDEGPFENPGIK